MEKKYLGLAFLATIVALWFLGLGPLISVPIAALIGCLSVIAEVAEPDNAWKRCIYRYSKVLLTLTVAVLVTVLVSLIFAVPLTKVVIEVLTGTTLVELSADGLEQYRIMSLVIIIFSSFLAYMFVYGGLTGKKWRVMVAGILLVVFLSAFWQINIKELPLGQRLAKHFSILLAKESSQLATINEKVDKVYLADYNVTKKTFTSITPQDRELKSGLVVQVRLASPIVMYAEQSFINVLLANDQGEFSLNLSDPGVWLPVEMVTMGRGKVSQPLPRTVAPLIDSSRSTIKAKSPIIGNSDILDSVPLEEVVQLKVPVLETETNSSTVIVRSDGWRTTGIVANLGDLIELGQFPVQEDIERLEARVNEGMISQLIPKQTNDGLWYVVLDFATGGHNKKRHPIELRLKYGLPLEVTVQKLEK